MIEKEALENCMEDYARFLWGYNFAPTQAQVDAFFAERGLTRDAAMEASLHHGVFLSVATLEEPAYELDRPLLVRFFKWIWQ